MNQTIKLLKDHTSIRKFNSEMITKEEEDMIIQSAMQGATAGNMMQYSIVTIRNKETLKALAESCDNQPFIANASFALLFVVDNSKWVKLFESRKIPESFADYNGAELPDFILGMQDAMIAAQNAVIAAESLNIGTCYIGDIIENKEIHTKMFNLPDYTMPATLIVMGKYDDKPKVRSRFDMNKVVFEEKYPDIDETFINEMFAKHESNNEDFAMKFYKRKIGASFFKEMIRSSKLYLNQWL